MNSELQVNTPNIKTNKLTKLERKWYKEYLNSFSASDALRKAYPDNKYSDDVLYSIAYQTKKSVFRKLQLEDDLIFEKLGVDKHSLIKQGVEGLKATKAVVVNGKVVGVPDFVARHKFWHDFAQIQKLITDTQKLELTGKDGEPLRIELVAGIGFLNKPKDENN